MIQESFLFKAGAQPARSASSVAGGSSPRAFCRARSAPDQPTLLGFGPAKGGSPVARERSRMSAGQAGEPGPGRSPVGPGGTAVLPIRSHSVLEAQNLGSPRHPAAF